MGSIRKKWTSLTIERGLYDAGTFQDSSPPEHWKSVAHAYDEIGGRLKFWEHTPRTIDEKQSPDNLNQHHDINVFWRVPKNIWGIDLRR